MPTFTHLLVVSSICSLASLFPTEPRSEEAARARAAGVRPGPSEVVVLAPINTLPPLFPYPQTCGYNTPRIIGFPTRLTEHDRSFGSVERCSARQTMYYHVQAPHSSHPSAYSTHTHSITQHPTEPTANTVLYPVTLGASIDERVTQRAAASDDAAMMAFFQPPPSPSSSHAGSRQGNKVKKAARTKSTSAQPRKSSKADGD